MKETENNKNSFILYHSQWDMLSVMSIEQRGELITAIFAYERTRELPTTDDLAVKVAFASIAGRLDFNREKYAAKCGKNTENVNKRWHGSPKEDAMQANTNVRKRTSPNTNVYERIPPNTNYTDNDTDTDTDTDNDTESESDIIARGLYKNVQISDVEYAELCEELGGAVCDGVIERLSFGIETKGYKYGNHAAVIREWAREDAAKKGGAGSDIDPDEYERAALARSARYLEDHKQTDSAEGSV